VETESDGVKFANPVVRKFACGNKKVALVRTSEINTAAHFFSEQTGQLASLQCVKPLLFDYSLSRDEILSFLTNLEVSE